MVPASLQCEEAGKAAGRWFVPSGLSALLVSSWLAVPHLLQSVLPGAPGTCPRLAFLQSTGEVGSLLGPQ